MVRNWLHISCPGSTMCLQCAGSRPAGDWGNPRRGLAGQRKSIREGLLTLHGTTMLAAFENILAALPGAAHQVYGERLVSLVVFGSVARGTPRPDSDIDLLVVAEGLARRRLARVEEFAAVENLLAPALASAKQAGVETYLAPVFKTPAEVRLGSLLFLDFVDDARLLYDRDSFFATFLQEFRARLQRLGAYKVQRGGAWYWVVKADYQPGEVFEL